MAVDLKSNSFFQRVSILLDADCLIKLEHERTKDRVRKVMFDRVERVLVWRTIPAVRITLVALFLGLPGLLLLIPGGAAVVFAVILLLLAGGIITFYLVCRKTTIRVVRAGQVDDVTGIFRPGKVRRLTAKMVNNIRATQESGFARLAAKQAAAASAPLNVGPARISDAQITDENPPSPGTVPPVI